MDEDKGNGTTKHMKKIHILEIEEKEFQKET